MSEFKVGDKVVLRTETKPYTFLNRLGSKSELFTEINDKEVYTIFDIIQDGDISIGKKYSHLCYISQKHIKHAKEDTSFEDYHEKLSQNYSESFTSLESDMKSELEELKYENSIELRLSIFNAKPNRTLEEMQAIESWLLGEK